MFDIYIRVSQLGERTPEEATLEYEAACREYAERVGIEIDEVAADTDVSGSTAVRERSLERLIAKVEAGDSEGIVTPYLDRFGRDLIEGALAYKRIRESAGRLVCVMDGQDSDRAGDELTFNLRLAIAQDYLNRVRANYQAAVNRKVDQRAHIYKTPFGYRKGDDGRLAVDEHDAALVQEVFERRAAGDDLGKLVRFLLNAGALNPYTGKPLTKSGVRSILNNRTYLGEIRVQNGKKGQPRVITGYHEPIITSAVFEAANAAKGAFHPRTRILVDQTMLRGLCYCDTCGRRLRVGGYTKGDKRIAMYACTYPDCAQRATIKAEKLDAWVQTCVQQAAVSRDPYVAAIIEGRSAFHDALHDVAEAQRLHDELRDDLDAQRQLGIRSWLAALRVRQQQLELARADLRKVRPASRQVSVRSLAEMETETLRQFVGKIMLRSVGRVGGASISASERADVYFVGATEPWTPPAGDAETLEVLRQSHRAA